eukprot:SAG22_NODE_43_length_25304_cov_5.394644_1_plen_966_part_00
MRRPLLSGALFALLARAPPAGARGDGQLIDCRWTVNGHGKPLHSQLSPALQSGLSARTASVYPSASATNGFIEYPTELFMEMPAAAAAPSSPAPEFKGGACSTVRNDTGAFESSYAHVAAPTIGDCCRACSADSRCKFAMFQAHNPLPTHHCWLCSASTLTPRFEKETQLITVADHPAPPPPPPIYWQDAWERNLVGFPKAMAQYTQAALNGSAEGLMMVDYEPQWRPSWRFPNPNGTAQPKWAAMLATVHGGKALDKNWTTLVGWAAPAGATNWGSLTAAQQTELQRVSWDFFTKKYLTAGLRAIKAALPAKVELAFWNWPYKFGKSLKPPWWDRVMDELGWLWAELPVMMPDLYPEFYSGAAASMPAVLGTPPAACTALGASTTAAYFQDNIDNALRLKAKYNPQAKVFLSVWWHYMCAQHVTGDLGYFVQDGNLDALFSATGHDGIALWGSVGVFPGEDANATQVTQYLETFWGPHVATHCRQSGPPLKLDDAPLVAHDEETRSAAPSGPECLVTETNAPRSDAWLYTSSGTLSWIEHTPLWCLQRASVWPAKDIVAVPKGPTIVRNQGDPNAACLNAGCCGNHSNPHPCGPPLPQPPPPPPSPAVMSVSPRRVAVEGGDELLVVGVDLENVTHCRLEPAPHSTSQQMTALVSFPAVVLNSSALKCVGVPAVLVPGPALLTLSSTGAAGEFQGDRSDYTNRVSYFSTVDVALDRRPYFSERSGNLLLAVDPTVVTAKKKLRVKAALPCAGPAAVWSWPELALSTTTEIVLPLPFDVLLAAAPAMLHNDLVVTITIGGTRTVSKLVRFMRVPPPPNGSTVEPVQVDHQARSLRVAGKLFNPVGWYVESDIPLDDLRRIIVAEFAPRGVNAAMIYGLNSPTKHTVEQLFEFLDACHAAGFKIWWPLEDGIGPVSLQRGGPFSDETRLVELKRQVNLVKDHPALLGWYICDGADRDRITMLSTMS